MISALFSSSQSFIAVLTSCWSVVSTFSFAVEFMARRVLPLDTTSKQHARRIPFPE